MTLPNFLVIGAGRSGTTSIHDYLGQHPEVFVTPEKSPNFFASHEPLPEWEGPLLQKMAAQWISNSTAYEALFEGVVSETAIGDISPVYLQAVSVPHRIRETCPDARLVAILREPVSRAYAHYLGRRRDGLDSRPDFRQVVQEELSRPMPSEVAFGSYLGCSHYFRFLRPYFELFPRERIHVYLFEDLQADAEGLMSDLYSFLGVDPDFAPATDRRYGRTGIPANPRARAVWIGTVGLRTALRPWLPRWLRDAMGRPFVRRLERPSLDPDLHVQLLELFREDTERLASLIGRDLSHWREAPGPSSATD